MKIWEQVQSSRSIILLNLVTLASALIWGLDVRFFLLFYWLESGVAGIFNVFKMLSVKEPGNARYLKLYLVLFFMVHYGLFMVGHLVFLMGFIGMFNSDLGAITYVIYYIRVFGINLVLLVVDYVIGFNSWRDTREELSVADLMFRPYGRIAVMQVTLIIGALLFFFLDSGKVFLVLLMILKTIADIRLKK